MRRRPHLHRGRVRRYRCVDRPTFTFRRYTSGEDGRLVYRMTRPRGGSYLLVLYPDEVLSPLAVLTPEN